MRLRPVLLLAARSRLAVLLAVTTGGREASPGCSGEVAQERRAPGAGARAVDGSRVDVT